MSAAGGSPRVDFYVLAGASAAARLRFTCRLVEKAYLAAQRVLVFAPDQTELEQLDELLWTFAEGSFVPHERVAAEAAEAEAPVLLSGGARPAGAIGVLVNLAPVVPPFFAAAARIAEVIDADPARREAGRARFRTYREHGLAPATHEMRG